MEKMSANTYDLYHDIQERCKGEIYIGVLGPVRTGKSTFIKRFMDVCVLPYMIFYLNSRNFSRLRFLGFRFLQLLYSRNRKGIPMQLYHVYNFLPF